MPSSRNVIALSAITAISAYVSVLLYQSVKEHGVESTIRYIWEGDYYSDEVRSSLDSLEELEAKFLVISTLLEKIDTSLARAKLNSFDDDPIVKKDDWTESHRPGNLEKDLARLSYDLDKLAAEVDSVLSRNMDVIRIQKKSLSTKIVKIMEGADFFLSLYQEQEKAT
mmetsp:Transcript_7411/g.10796  ORF Transcript_7411/g.10796 Transcript_7411/m.10796 type:complete len:168 (-) Transcript_7411:85-588(-)